MELKLRPQSFKLVIPEEVERKIRFLCTKVWDVEWSGTLFYKPEGNFEDGSLVIRCTDIFVMDIGNATYTEFDMSPEVIAYMAENPELLDCQAGLIHSHNHMTAFFSTTDLNTLREEGRDRNHFVSLIVNNAGTYTAAITRKIRTVSESFTYPTFNDGEVSSRRDSPETEEYLEYFNLDIEFEGEHQSFEELDARLEEIRKAKRAMTAKKASGVFRSPYYREYELYDRYEEEPSSLFPSYREEIPTINTGGPANRISQPAVPQAERDSKETEPQKPGSTENPQAGETDDSDVFPLGKYHLNPKTVKSLVLQLITGSVILPNESKIDTVKWVKGMSSLYRKRFGEGKKGMEKFRVWAEGYIEFLCWYIEDKDLEEIDKEWGGEATPAICAWDLLGELEKLPKNEYIEVYKEILETYL